MKYFIYDQSTFHFTVTLISSIYFREMFAGFHYLLPFFFSPTIIISLLLRSFLFHCLYSPRTHTILAAHKDSVIQITSVFLRTPAPHEIKRIAFIRHLAHIITTIFPFISRKS